MNSMNSMDRMNTVSGEYKQKYKKEDNNLYMNKRLAFAQQIRVRQRNQKIK